MDRDAIQLEWGWRLQCTSLGAVFGGTLPLVAIALIELTHNKLAPAWYIFGWTILVILFAIFLKETYKNSLG